MNIIKSKKNIKIGIETKKYLDQNVKKKNTQWHLKRVKEISFHPEINA